MPEIILASGSQARKTLLNNAGLRFRAQPARIDEAAIKAALVAEGATPRDIADALAEFKARKVAEKHPGAVVIGSDQVLEFQGAILSKPGQPGGGRRADPRLRGQQHRLLSAVVVYEVGTRLAPCRAGAVDDARCQRRFLDGYLDRNWPGIGDSVGGYKLEEEGIRLFSRIDGDYFTVLGLPLLDLLGFLAQKGVIDG